MKYVKKIFLLCFIFSIALCFVACSSRGGGSSEPSDNNKKTDSSGIEIAVASINDFNVDFSVNATNTELTAVVNSELIFNQIEWWFDDSKLPDTGNSISIDISNLGQGAYNLFVTGINNSIVYSSSYILSIK